MLTVKLEQLAGENARLRSEAGAHDVLRNIYGDASQPAGVRVKAAQAALNVEKPRLVPQPPPLDLVAKPIEPLADLVARRRRRSAALEGVPPGDPRWLLWVERADGTYPADDPVALPSPGQGNSNGGTGDDTSSS